MITEHVDIELAKLLKAKGFNEETGYIYRYYESDDDYCFEKLLPGEKFVEGEMIHCPTIQTARTWLDDTFDIRVFVFPARDTRNYMCHVFSIWKMDEESGEFNEVYLSPFYEQYNECMEDGVRYSLVNLI